jgi:hypothetical protein
LFLEDPVASRYDKEHMRPIQIASHARNFGSSTPALDPALWEQAYAVREVFMHRLSIHTGGGACMITIQLERSPAAISISAQQVRPMGGVQLK